MHGIGRLVCLAMIQCILYISVTVLYEAIYVRGRNQNGLNSSYPFQAYRQQCLHKDEFQNNQLCMEGTEDDVMRDFRVIFVHIFE